MAITHNLHCNGVMEHADLRIHSYIYTPIYYQEFDFSQTLKNALNSPKYTACLFVVHNATLLKMSQKLSSCCSFRPPPNLQNYEKQHHKISLR